MDNFQKRLIRSALKDCIRIYRENEASLILIINGIRFIGIDIKPFINNNNISIYMDLCTIDIPFDEINEVLLFDLDDEETTVFLKHR